MEDNQERLHPSGLAELTREIREAHGTPDLEPPLARGARRRATVWIGLDGRIPLRQGNRVVGYATLDDVGGVQVESSEPTPELPTPPFGGRPAYQRIFDALRNVDLNGPVGLEFAVANGLESVVVGVMQALFDGHTNNADQRYPRIELPWPTSAGQFEELLVRIPLWSIVAHLVRDRDTQVQHREYLARMFPDDKVPPLLDHLNRMLRDSRELWQLCVNQERMLARIGEALDATDPVAAVRAVLEAGRG